MKIVINRCYGGFSISREAVLRAREISGNPNWGGNTIKGDIYESGYIVNEDYGHIDNVERNDPILVQVVEELGEKANGYAAKLFVDYVAEGTKYRIQEYDGMEWIESADDVDWKLA